ncbi:MAG: hypothetical protein KatS3mg096_043 [Candidatus Parcubacteria bacterium]|nr:MAG: hypothetical protein KatS3mg096_043 [Candidatus Parcubacteria bacterium]
MIEPGFLKLINSLFNLIFVLSLSLLAGVIIYLGIIYITSPAEEKIKKVHKRWGLILGGIVLVFLSRTIPKLIEMFFK